MWFCKQSWHFVSKAAAAYQRSGTGRRSRVPSLLHKSRCHLEFATTESGGCSSSKKRPISTPQLFANDQLSNLAEDYGCLFILTAGLAPTDRAPVIKDLLSNSRNLFFAWGSFTKKRKLIAVGRKQREQLRTLNASQTTNSVYRKTSSKRPRPLL